MRNKMYWISTEANWGIETYLYDSTRAEEFISTLTALFPALSLSCWLMAPTSNLLPAISACGGRDEVSSSLIRIGFSAGKPLCCETNPQTLVQHCCQSPLLKPLHDYWRQMCVFNLSECEERVFAAEFIVYQMGISVLSCTVCFSLKAARFDFTFCSGFRDLCVNLLCREDWWHHGDCEHNETRCSVF